MLVGLRDIVVGILLGATSKLTLNQVTTMVENHPEWRGKSKGQDLAKRIRQILEEYQDEFEYEDQGPNITFGLKLGRVNIKGRIDLS